MREHRTSLYLLHEESGRQLPSTVSSSIKVKTTCGWHLVIFDYGPLLQKLYSYGGNGMQKLAYPFALGIV